MPNNVRVLMFRQEERFTPRLKLEIDQIIKLTLRADPLIRVDESNVSLRSFQDPKESGISILWFIGASPGRTVEWSNNLSDQLRVRVDDTSARHSFSSEISVAGHVVFSGHKVATSKT